MTKDDIFNCAYGLRHSDDYRTQSAADLRRTLPRIPKVPAEHFQLFVDVGRTLMRLHIDYEGVDPFALDIRGDTAAGDLSALYQVEKLKWKKGDKFTLVYNSRITIAGVPDEAHEYLLGSRSAIEWIIDRYQVKTDKASSIVNDHDDWSRETPQPRYIRDLIAKVVTVSVETIRIVKSLPTLNFIEVKK